MTSNVKDKETKLLVQYDERDNDEFYNGPQNRLPYLGDPSKNGPLLTTSNYLTNTPYGAIISKVGYDGMRPSAWVWKLMPSPDHIWYWINENDCDANRERGTSICLLLAR